MIRFEAHTYESAASPTATAWHELAAMRPRSPIRISIFVYEAVAWLFPFGHGSNSIDLKSKNISLEAASATSDISFVKANLGSSKMEDIARKDSVGPGSTCK